MAINGPWWQAVEVIRQINKTSPSGKRGSPEEAEQMESKSSRRFGDELQIGNSIGPPASRGSRGQEVPGGGSATER